MTYSLNVIYDGQIGENAEVITQAFMNSPILVFSFPDGDFEGQISGYISTNLSLVGTIEEKDLLLDKFTYNITNLEESENPILEDLSLTPIFDSLYLYRLPFEFVNSELEFFLRLNIGEIESKKLRVYTFQTDATNDKLKDDLEDIKGSLQEISTKQTVDNALQVADIAQDASIARGLAIVATGLIPVTAGVTTGALPFFGGASVPLLPSG